MAVKAGSSGATAAIGVSQAINTITDSAQAYVASTQPVYAGSNVDITAKQDGSDTAVAVAAIRGNRRRDCF